MKNYYECEELNKFIETHIHKLFNMLKKYRAGSSEFNYCWDCLKSSIDSIKYSSNYSELNETVPQLIRTPHNSVCSDEV